MFNALYPHAQVVLTVAIAFIVEAFVHKYDLAQFATERGTYVYTYVCKLSNSLPLPMSITHLRTIQTLKNLSHNNSLYVPTLRTSEIEIFTMHTELKYREAVVKLTQEDS